MEQELETILAASLGLLIFVLLIAIAFAIVYVIALAKLFKKAGIEGWKAIIPFYNIYLLVKIAGLNWWYFLIAISGTICSLLRIRGLNYACNIASMAVNFFILYNIAKKMKQQPMGFAIAGIFVQPIMIMVLGFSSKYSYDPSIEVSPNGPIGENSTNNSTSSNATIKYCSGCGSKIISGSQFCDKCGKKVE